MVEIPYVTKVAKKITESEDSLKKKFAIDLSKNEALAGRLEDLGTDMEFIEDPTKDINKRIMKLNKLVVIAGWAWARAGDKGKESEYMDMILTNWNIAMGQWRDYYAMIKPREQTEEADYKPRKYLLTVKGQKFMVVDDLTPRPGELLTPMELKYLVVGAGERDWITAGMTILHRTFKDRDVAVQYVTMYQGVQQQYSGIQDTRNLGGDAEKPNKDALPKVSSA